MTEIIASGHRGFFVILTEKFEDLCVLAEEFIKQCKKAELELNEEKTNFI